jgi:hypothetical protein
MIFNDFKPVRSLCNTDLAKTRLARTRGLFSRKAENSGVYPITLNAAAGSRGTKDRGEQPQKPVEKE